MKFNELELHPKLLKAIKELGYTKASPIQEQAIPYGLKGKDILGCAQTGTGKTAAFALPILQGLVKEQQPQHIRALVLTPTRELATQIMENFQIYGKYFDKRCYVVFGGVNQNPQEAALRKGVDILVATPGRLLDLIKQKIVHLNNVEYLVLDEADRMLDMGFLPDVKRILQNVPAKRQTMLFSATMPDDIRSLANSLLHDPVNVEVTPVSSTVDKITQQLYYVDKANKSNLLLELLKDKKIESALVFTRTKSGANRVTKFLNAHHINASAIHGDRSQNARQLALSGLKKGTIRVLVATDIAARGIDIDELSHVFNYDIPVDAESYVHRIGRTGRAGHNGIAISFSNFDEITYVKAIEKLIRIHIPVIKEHAYPMMILEPTPKQVRQPRKKAIASKDSTQPKQSSKKKKTDTAKQSDATITKQFKKKYKEKSNKSKTKEEHRRPQKSKKTEERISGSESKSKYRGNKKNKNRKQLEK